MNLPQAFLERIQTQLGSEYDDFLASYADEPSYGLRINPLKGAPDAISPELPFVLSPVAWTPEGYHADPGEHPGRHPLHEAGVYYIQDPSAMSIVSLLDPRPGEMILDLCAAPGGKSTQIAGRLQGEGFVVSNEIIPGRAKILSQNMERMGIRNAVVCNEDPKHLAERFPHFFDKIVVDAPCSGEGMFRKDDTAITEWSPDLVHMCAKRQQEILFYAEQMLRPGGVLVYSTCTFAPEEDEEQIQNFLQNYPEYELQDWQEYLPNADQAMAAGVQSGTLPGTMRLWPHKLPGEGHFAARLHHTASSKSIFPETSRPTRKSRQNRKAKQADFSEFYHWQQEAVPQMPYSLPTEHLQFFGEELYLLPENIPSLQGIKILRAGLHLGTRKKNRFEPSHALAKCLTPQEVRSFYPCNDEEAICYLHGDVLQPDSSGQNTDQEPPLQGWTLICYGNYPLGWAKASQGTLKNHYPKGLRIHF